MKNFLLLTLLLSTSLSAFAQTCESRGPNVILFTWDGVRPQEFFRGTGWLLEQGLPHEKRGEILSTFWEKYAEQGMIMGGHNRYRVGSDVAVSLPSYQSIMMGKSTNCLKNDCASVAEETMLETLVKKLNLPKKDVAVFASWNRILAAVAQNPETITHGIYPGTFDDGTNDPVFKDLQEKAMTDLPEWKGSRKDKYTFPLAMHYLKKHCPRFLYISLVDSDEFGHAGNYDGYVTALRTYDQYLDELLKTVDSLGEYGKNTTVFVTTDHSRGAGPFWKGHGHTKFTEKNIFLYVKGPKVLEKGRTHLHGNHLMLRPTIEALMGLPVESEKLPGLQL